MEKAPTCRVSAASWLSRSAPLNTAPRQSQRADAHAPGPIGGGVQQGALDIDLHSTKHEEAAQLSLDMHNCCIAKLSIRQSTPHHEVPASPATGCCCKRHQPADASSRTATTDSQDKSGMASVLTSLFAGSFSVSTSLATRALSQSIAGKYRSVGLFGGL